MTNEEAILMLERIMYDEDNHGINWATGAKEAFNMAISALEKQIPKKPKVLIDTWLCPTCAEKVEYQTMLGDNVLYNGCYDFCPNCGADMRGE